MGIDVARPPGADGRRRVLRRQRTVRVHQLDAANGCPPGRFAARPVGPRAAGAASRQGRHRCPGLPGLGCRRRRDVGRAIAFVDRPGQRQHAERHDVRRGVRVLGARPNDVRTRPRPGGPGPGERARCHGVRRHRADRVRHPQRHARRDRWARRWPRGQRCVLRHRSLWRARLVREHFADGGGAAHQAAQPCRRRVLRLGDRPVGFASGGHLHRGGVRSSCACARGRGIRWSSQVPPPWGCSCRW